MRHLARVSNWFLSACLIILAAMILYWCIASVTETAPHVGPFPAAATEGPLPSARLHWNHETGYVEWL